MEQLILTRMDSLFKVTDDIRCGLSDLRLLMKDLLNLNLRSRCSGDNEKNGVSRVIEEFSKSETGYVLEHNCHWLHLELGEYSPRVFEPILFSEVKKMGMKNCGGKLFCAFTKDGETTCFPVWLTDSSARSLISVSTVTHLAAAAKKRSYEDVTKERIFVFNEIMKDGSPEQLIALRMDSLSKEVDDLRYGLRFMSVLLNDSLTVNLRSICSGENGQNSVTHVLEECFKSETRYILQYDINLVNLERGKLSSRFLLADLSSEVKMWTEDCRGKLFCAFTKDGGTSCFPVCLIDSSNWSLMSVSVMENLISVFKKKRLAAAIEEEVSKSIDSITE